TVVSTNRLSEWRGQVRRQAGPQFRLGRSPPLRLRRKESSGSWSDSVAPDLVGPRRTGLLRAWRILHLRDGRRRERPDRRARASPEAMLATPPEKASQDRGCHASSRSRRKSQDGPELRLLGRRPQNFV